MSSSRPKTSPIPPRAPDATTKVYKGGCHCGKFAFECRHPVLEDSFEVVSCNCSICVQRGYLIMYIMNPEQDLTLTKGAHADLTRYTFNRGIITHMFCPSCGCGLFGESSRLIAVNVRTLEGVDPEQLRLKKWNGRAD